MNIPGTLALTLSLVFVPQLSARQITLSGTFVIRTSDNKVGMLTLVTDRGPEQVGRWHADSVLAKLLGKKNGYFTISPRGLFLDSEMFGGRAIALLQSCEWDLLEEDDSGEMDINPGGGKAFDDWDNAPIKAGWRCKDCDYRSL
jgi:hypothetical protein